MTDRLVWIDCEMTGLNLERDALIEIACLVTDGSLDVLDEGLDLVIKPPPEALDQMEDVVREMHTASGLLSELAAGVTLAEASVKVRTGPPGDEPEDLELPVWAGVVPTGVSFGDPEPDPALRPGIVAPDHIRSRAGLAAASRSA